MKFRKNAKMMMYGALALSLTASVTSCKEDDDVVKSQKTYIYTSNNADGNINYYDVTDLSNVIATNIVTPSVAADGIFYDASSDAVVQASRTTFGLEGIINVSSLSSGASGVTGIVRSLDMQSPWETAVIGNTYVVADNADADGNTATADGKLYIYTKSGNTFSLRNVITTDFKLWGITFIGNDLYAVVDADNEIAVYTNFLSNTSNTTLSATKRVEVEGIVRTHGLTYDGTTMIMTDIGNAMNTTDDGGFHIIKDFLTKFNGASNGGMITLAQQTRVSGAATLLGNPVDVAYDSSKDIAYIAEAGNGGGSLLIFNGATKGGNLNPTVNIPLKSASAVFLVKK